MILQKIALIGGGTMGSVSPLLAIKAEIVKRNPQAQFIWIGTQDGPERALIESEGIPFYAVSTGKFRRYFSIKNFIDPFKVFLGYLQSKKLLKEFAPNIVLTAGSFVCVPASRAAYKLGIPYVVHQQDIVKGLANKLMEKHAAFNTITFDPSLADYNIKNTYYTSNPARLDMNVCTPDKARALFALDQTKPVVLVMGGGLGAVAVNTLLLESLGEIATFAQIIHLTGKGKSISERFEEFYSTADQLMIRQNYFPLEFATDEMCSLLSVADVVVTRAGLSSLTELSLLHKATIIIPIPSSHQEENAKYFAKFNAAVTLDQNTTTPEQFAKQIKEILTNPATKQNLQKNISQMIDPRASEKYVDLIEKYLLSRK